LKHETATKMSQARSAYLAERCKE